jgi:hypothetical protein
VTAAPRDPDVRKKYKECEKAYKEAMLREAIAIDHSSQSVIEKLGNLDEQGIFTFPKNTKVNKCSCGIFL